MVRIQLQFFSINSKNSEIFASVFTEIITEYNTAEPRAIVENPKSKTFLVLGGNLASWKDSEILDFSKKYPICSKPANIPERFSKSAVGAYFDKKVLLCGGHLAGKECTEYAFDENEWFKVPYHLTIERVEAAGMMLQNGSWMIIGGKGPDGEPLFSTDFLNNGLFEPNLEWPEAMSGHCVKKINTSHTFVSGGEGKSGNLLGAVYFFNVETSFWLSLDEKMIHNRRGHVCGIVKNENKEYIIMAGGKDLLKTELLDMKTMRFRQGPDLPFKMDWASSIQLEPSSFAIVGGEHIGYCSQSGMCISSNAIFGADLENNNWKTLEQSLNLPRSKHILIAIDDGDISNDLCQDGCPKCQG